MKKANGFGLLSVIIIVIVTAIITSVATGIIMMNNPSSGNVSNADAKNDKELNEFINVYQTLLSKYYDSNIDKSGMLKAAEEGMLNFLNDKYTTYLDNDEYQGILDELSGTYNGIGVMIEKNRIVKVTPSSPAEKAGILAEDIIIKVNKEEITEESSEKIRDLIRDESAKTVELVIKRGDEEKTFTLNKETLINPTIGYKVLDNTKIGYLAITNFSQNLEEQVKEALEKLENDGITSLIIDVRDNVGGYLSAAEDVSSLFLEEGKIIYSLETNNRKYAYKDKTKEKREYPIVVLINGNSASASEILAAALKESYNATLVGTKSYGKGKVQQVVSLTSGDSVKYTSARWLTPTGNCIDGYGIIPDHIIKYSPGIHYDTQLEKAVELLS